MSPIDSIPGIEGLVIQSVERAKNIHVWARMTARPYCTAQSLRIKAIYERTFKHSR